MNIAEIMNIRFDSTKHNLKISDLAKANEQFVQWLTEVVFIRDFIYRNPPLVPGKEFSDALIIFFDTAIIIQMKTKQTKKDIDQWLPKNLNDAIRQLNGSYRMIKQDLVKRFHNELLGIDIEFDKDKIKNIYGIVVLAIDENKVSYEKMIQKNNIPKIQTIILSQNDLNLICQRMTTAIDFLNYFEFRHDLIKLVELFLNDEETTMKNMIDQLKYLIPKDKNISQEKSQKTIDIIKSSLTGDILSRSDFQYGLLVDDMIARAHDLDECYKNIEDKNKALKIAECLGCLTRDRRIAIGKKLYEKAIQAKETGLEIFVHLQRPIRQLYIYIYTNKDRASRKELGEMLTSIAQYKYDNINVITIITEPIGLGRSYDYILTEERLYKEGIIIPEEILKILPELNGELIKKI
ncbi:MAG: hypothetical protein ACYC1A_06785 [Spirochaetales bacterium]|jgi:hypothetical protein